MYPHYIHSSHTPHTHTGVLPYVIVPIIIMSLYCDLGLYFSFSSSDYNPIPAHTTHTVTDVERDSAGCDKMTVDLPVAMATRAGRRQAGGNCAPPILPPDNSQGVCGCGCGQCTNDCHNNNTV